VTSAGWHGEDEPEPDEANDPVSSKEYGVIAFDPKWDTFIGYLLPEKELALVDNIAWDDAPDDDYVPLVNLDGWIKEAVDHFNPFSNTGSRTVQ